jgi:hypothetical protein
MKAPVVANDIAAFRIAKRNGAGGTLYSGRVREFSKGTRPLLGLFLNRRFIRQPYNLDQYF